MQIWTVERGEKLLSKAGGSTIFRQGSFYKSVLLLFSRFLICNHPLSLNQSPKTVWKARHKHLVLSENTSPLQLFLKGGRKTYRRLKLEWCEAVFVSNDGIDNQEL